MTVAFLKMCVMTVENIIWAECGCCGDSLKLKVVTMERQCRQHRDWEKNEETNKQTDTFSYMTCNSLYIDRRPTISTKFFTESFPPIYCAHVV